jgi:RNA polymerase sigma factor (sigma-70 family)
MTEVAIPIDLDRTRVRSIRQSSRFRVDEWPPVAVFGPRRGSAKYGEESIQLESDLARGGDRNALAVLLRTVEPDLRRFAARLCPSESDADDAVQRAMLAMSLKLEAFRGLSRFSTWIFAVIRNECRKYASKMRRFLFQAEDTVDLDARSPEDDLERQRLLELVVRAISELGSESLEVFVLREIEGLSTAACAAQLGIAENNAKVRLSRARAALRLSLSSLSARVSEADASTNSG